MITRVNVFLAMFSEFHVKCGSFRRDGVHKKAPQSYWLTSENAANEAFTLTTP